MRPGCAPALPKVGRGSSVAQTQGINCPTKNLGAGPAREDEHGLSALAFLRDHVRAEHIVRRDHAEEGVPGDFRVFHMGDFGTHRSDDQCQEPVGQHFRDGFRGLLLGHLFRFFHRVEDAPEDFRTVLRPFPEFLSGRVHGRVRNVPIDRRTDSGGQFEVRTWVFVVVRFGYQLRADIRSEAHSAGAQESQ